MPFEDPPLGRPRKVFASTRSGGPSAFPVMSASTMFLADHPNPCHQAPRPRHVSRAAADGSQECHGMADAIPDLHRRVAGGPVSSAPATSLGRCSFLRHGRVVFGGRLPAGDLAGGGGVFVVFRGGSEQPETELSHPRIQDGRGRRLVFRGRLEHRLSDLLLPGLRPHVGALPLHSFSSLPPQELYLASSCRWGWRNGRSSSGSCFVRGSRMVAACDSGGRARARGEYGGLPRGRRRGPASGSAAFLSWAFEDVDPRPVLEPPPQAEGAPAEPLLDDPE